MSYDDIPALEHPRDLFDLSGRVILIVGGAGLLGRQFAATLGHAGAQVVLADVDAARSEEAAAEAAGRTGAKVWAVAMDAGREESVRQAVGELRQRAGRLDGLIFGPMAKPAGYYKPFGDYRLEAWRAVIDTNLTGAFLCCREAAPLLAERGGSVVLVSSVYGLVGPDQRIYEECSPAGNIYGGADPLNAPAPYAASKAGLAGLGRYLATLWGPRGVRVNVLFPGGVWDGHEEAFHRRYVARTVLGRMAVRSDFNGAVLFLMSDASRYMTGAHLIIDGGWTAW